MTNPESLLPESQNTSESLPTEVDRVRNDSIRVRSYEISFRVETAVFLHGGEGIGSAELRVSAIKGMMRYWFRANALLHAGDQQVAALERELFGGRGRQSAFQLSVAEFNRQQAVQDRGLYLLPHKEQPNIRQNSSAIRAGSTFAVRLSPRSGGVLDQPRYELILWTLWCAAHLGGIGLRSRRGAGSLSIRKITPPCDSLVTTRDLESPESAAELLEKGLSRMHEILRGLLPGASASSSPTPRLSTQRSVTVARVAPATLDEQEVRRSVMLLLRPFKNAAFGLPLRLESGWVRSQSGVRRQASPVHLHLFRGKESWLLVVSQLRPLPEADGVSGSQIEAFLTSLNGQSLRIESGAVGRESAAGAAL